ncbi:MAG: dsDNA nuclease domain-containing protein [Devosia sp.]
MSESASGISSKRRRDVGDETARNYRYQYSYGVILLAAAARGDRPYSAIWCEHHDDLLAERHDGKFEAWQIKTRRPETGSWTLGNADFLGALKRYVDMNRAVGEKIERFYFVSNTEFEEASENANKSRLIRSPRALLAAVHASGSYSALALPFSEVVESLAAYSEVPADRMFAVLSRVHLVLGPSRGEIDASLSNEHLARVEVHSRRSAIELDEVRDLLVAKVERASSLQVTDPERHLRAITDRGARDPQHLAKRVAVEVVAETRPRQPAEATEEDLAGLHVKIDDLAQRLSESGALGGLNRDQVVALLRAFSEVEVDPSNAMDLLVRKATELRTLQDDVAQRVAAETQGDTSFAPVLEAFKAGDFDMADTALENLASSGARTRNKTLIETVQLYILRSDLAYARLRYEEAAEHLGTAATIAGTFDKTYAFDLLGLQAQVHVDQAVLLGGLPPFLVAFEICARRIGMAPENSEQRVAATVLMISYFGVASERAPTPQARDLASRALEIGRPLLESLDPAQHAEAWIPLANTLGAVLNNAARFDNQEEGTSATAREAVDILSLAARAARKSDHPELSNIESNLATAYRYVARSSSNPRRELKRSITHRLRAIQFEASLSTEGDQLGNAYDSLGNDYSQLAEAGPEFDRDAFRRAMAAYRRALRFRQKEIAPINWARTQFNTATTYSRACRRAGGDAARRYGLAALTRFDLALSVLSPSNAPNDWANSCFQMAITVAEMIDAKFAPGIDRIERAVTLLAEVGDVTDGTADFEFATKALDTQSYFAQYLFAQRGPDAGRLIELAQSRLRPRLDRYRHTPLQLLFALADAQFSFMLAHLAGSRPGVDKAIAALEGRASRPFADEDAPLIELAREVLVDMRLLRGQMDP